MDLKSAPARPPPPPPPASAPTPPPQLQQQQPLDILADEQDIAPLHVPEGRQDLAASDYVDSPEQVTSPPSFAEALMAASPTSPPDYTPYSPGTDPLARALASPAQRYTDEPRYADEPAYAADSGDEEGASTTAGEHREGEGQGQGGEAEEEDEDEEIPELPPVIVITGASSGLGLAFFQHFAAREPSCPEAAKYDVVGVDKSPWRLPGKGFQWRTTIGRCGKFVQLDLTAPERRLQNFARNHLYAYATSTSTSADPHAAGEDAPRRRYPRPVSLIIHCAATRGLVPAAEDAFRGDPTASAALDVMDAETMRRAFDVNVVGGLQLVQALLPHLQLHAERVRERRDELADAFFGAGAGGGAAVSSTEWLDQLRQQGSRASLQVSRPLPPREPPPRVVVMGSRLGSVSANAVGGAYAYRASKAALNAVVRSLSIDVPEVCFASVYPGSLKTGMISVKEEPVITYEESLEAMLPLIDRLGDGKLVSGCFVDRFGDPMKF